MRGLLYIIILLIITGCRFADNQPEELRRAQRLMESDPTAALSVLNDLDVSEFKDSATMAQWALLYSEAMVVNRLAAPTDTIINIAVDYYGSHNLRDEFQKASRLKALIRSGNDSDALATALYLQKQKEFLLYKERAKREMYLFIGVVILLVAAGVIVVMRQRLRMKSLENEALMAEASGLKLRIDAGSKDVDRLQGKLHGLLDNRFELIDSLCQTYYESQGMKNERKAIIDKVRGEINSVTTDSFPKLEQVVNDCRDDLLLRVKEAWPDIKPGDYQLLVYLACGLSPRTISLLIGESVDVVYKRKSRLKARIKEVVESAVPDIMTVF